MKKNTALVAGANGIIGRNLIDHLTSLDDWDVIASARNKPHYDSTAKFVSIDLGNANAVNEAATNELKEVTHLFFVAYTEKQTPYELSVANLAILKNIVLALEKMAPNLKRVLIIQGGKAYGAHLGMYKTPAYETDLRSITPNFYYDQEDFLRNQSVDKKWSWTILRPDIVIGFTIGNPMNLANLIAVYATLCKEEGIPMRFPGSPRAYDIAVNVTGAELLAKALNWSALKEECAGEIFNITNGDVFRWNQVWPKMGAFFGVEVAEPQTFSLKQYMLGKKDLWNKIISKYGLKPYTLDELVQWGFGDFIFNVEYDAFFDVNKARRFGFHEMNGDSLGNFERTFQHLRNEKIVP